MSWFDPWSLVKNKDDSSNEPLLSPAPIDDGILDSRSGTWAYLNKYLNAELVRAREANDSIRRTEIQTAEIRGRIRLIKELIDLPTMDKKKNKPKSQRDVDDYDY
jgi:hypothetical protein